MAQEQKPERRTILVLRFSALGDVAMVVPVLYGVCAANPEVDFVFVTKAPTVGLLLNPPENLRIVGADLKEKYKGLTGMRHLLRDLVADHGITDVADLHDVLRTKYVRIVARLKGLNVAVIRKGRKDKEMLVKGHLRQLPTSAERYAAVFAELGLATGGDFTSVFAAKAPDPALFADVTPPKKAGETWVGIAPFAAHPQKIYPTAKMEEVIASLSHRKGYRLFLFGGGERERRQFEDWVRGYPNVVSLADKRHGFAAELSLMSSLDAMVAMDSGNMHLAALAGVPTVSIWGATHPFAGFTSWHSRPELILQGSCPSRPCSVFGNKPCPRGDMRCFNSVTPGMIIEKIDLIVNGE